MTRKSPENGGERRDAAAEESARRDGPPVLSIGSMLAVALSLALITAFGELTLLAILKFRFHRELHLGPHVVWMTPVALTVVFAVPTILLVAGSLAWRRIARPSFFVAALVFLMMINLILVERHFSIWALLILSLGIAVQTGRLAESHYPLFRRILRLTTPALLGLVALATIGVEGRLALREARAEDGLPAASDGSPNVLFIILDTARARTMSLYGYERETTPRMDELAERGVVFDFAAPPGTWTVPSHGAMFTSYWPNELGAWWRSEDKVPPVETLASFMSRKGYRTAGFIGNWFHIGAESGMGTGFIHYDDLGRSPAQIARGSGMIRWLSQRRTVRRIIGLYETLGRRRAPDVSASFLRWLDHDSDRPWFAFLNYFDVHSPALPPAPFDERFGTSGASREPVIIEELNRVVDVPPDVALAELDAYDGAMAYLDDQIGLLFDELDRRGALDNTIVIISSDHGEELGEHGSWGHAYSLYAEIVHVPLILFGPGVPAGIRIARPASTRSIALTIADLARLEDAPFRGVTLAQHWRSPSLPDSAYDPAYSEFGKYQSLYGDRYHYFEGIRDDLEHLFDFRSDPLDEFDLVHAVGDSILDVFRERLPKITKPVDRDADIGVPPAGN